MKIKNLFIGIFLVLFFVGCNQEPELYENEYEIIDTLDVSESGLGKILGYDVIIKIKRDSTYHYGYIEKDGKLKRVNVRSIDTDKFK